MATGRRCSGTLIEIEDRGTRLIGCLACNDWRSLDGLRRVKLADDDVGDQPNHSLSTANLPICITLRNADIHAEDNNLVVVYSSPEARRNRDRTSDAQKGRASGAVEDNSSRGGHTMLCPLGDSGF